MNQIFCWPTKFEFPLARAHTHARNDCCQQKQAPIANGLIYALAVFAYLRCPAKRRLVLLIAAALFAADQLAADRSGGSGGGGCVAAKIKSK